MKLKVDKSRVKARWEEDYELIPNEGLFQEYLEMGKLFVNIFSLIPTTFNFANVFCFDCDGRNSTYLFRLKFVCGSNQY